LCACGGADVSPFDATADVAGDELEHDAAADVAGDELEHDAAADVTGDELAGDACTPIADGGPKPPAIGCQCDIQNSACNFGSHAADCQWFVGYVNSSCTTGCTFYELPDSGACERCAETYNCACITPLLSGSQWIGITCVDSDAGPYLKK
jgi:hypothetical protein